MDPAGPLFFNDLPSPYSGLNCPSGARLNVSDADLVDVIHTDGKKICFVNKNSEFLRCFLVNQNKYI